MTNQDMQILPVSQYHAVMREKYTKDVAGHEYGKGGFPYIGFYLFYTNQGNERVNGFVATDSVFNKACWGETKQSAINKFKTFGGLND